MPKRVNVWKISSKDVASTKNMQTAIRTRSAEASAREQQSARALAVSPEILICDEATSALDVTVQKQILELLIELKQKENLSFLLICHDLALVQKFCDRVLVLYHGKTVECGTPDEIINHPKMEYTKKLIDSVL